jgi:hypothetical protein
MACWRDGKVLPRCDCGTLARWIFKERSHVSENRHVLVFHRSTVAAAEAYGALWQMGKTSSFNYNESIKEFLDELYSQIVESRDWGMSFSDGPRRPSYALILAPEMEAAERVANLARAHGLTAYISAELPDENSY